LGPFHPGLVHPHLGEVGESVHHWHALDRFSISVRRVEEASENIFWELQLQIFKRILQVIVVDEVSPVSYWCLVSA